MADVLPQLGETDIKRQQHHHAGQYAHDEEKVVKTLLGPPHNIDDLRIFDLQFVGKLLAERLVAMVDVLPEQAHRDNLEHEVACGHVEQTEQE